MSDIQILVIPWGSILAALAFGYLLGSTPFGLILTRAAGLGDVRKIGSGNIGATNVLRTGRKGLAALTLLLDALKGTAAVLIAGWVAGRDPTVATGFAQAFALGMDQAMAAGFGAFLGHLFPVWLGFRGGKGVATFLGVVVALAWQGAVAFAIVWLAVAAVSRYSSLAALIAAVAVPVAVWFTGQPEIAILLVIMGAIIFLKHRANIARLLAGTESRIGAKG